MGLKQFIFNILIIGKESLTRSSEVSIILCNNFPKTNRQIA